MLGDCLEKMKELDDSCIDLIVTSPPYDDLRTYNDSLCFTFDKFKLIVKEIRRVIKPGGIIVWVVNDKTHKGSESGTSFKQALYFKEIGFNLHDTMIWKKDSCPFPDKTRYYSNFEYMFIFSKGRPKTFNPIKDRKNKHEGVTRKHIEYDKRKSKTTVREGSSYIVGKYGVRYNVWEIGVGKGKMGYDGGDHPAIFPLILALDHIKSWSNENDVVMDPFMGSGTTGVASKNLNRKFIGIEKNGDYFSIALKRINEVR